jgi:hypothetical protein
MKINQINFKKEKVLKKMDDHSNEKMENDKQIKQLEYNEKKMQK